MSDDNVTIENNENKTDKEPKRKSKLFPIIFIFLIFALLGGLIYGYYQLAKINLSLAHMLSAVKQETKQQQTDVTSLKQSLSQMEETVKNLQTISKQEEEIIGNWQNAQKGDLNKWYVAEAKYLVSLAKDHSEFTHNNTLSLILMQRAMQILQRLPSDARLLDLQKSLNENITKLQTATGMDATQLYIELNTLQTLVNQLPIPATPLSNANKQESTIDSSKLPWWKAGFYYSLQQLQKIVIVKYNPDRVLPLVLPEEKHFLYQNLHAVLEDAMWGALHHDERVYKASLDRAKSWISSYFDQNAAITQTVLKKIADLETVSWQAATIDFNATLQLFDNYFSDNTQTENQN